MRFHIMLYFLMVEKVECMLACFAVLKYMRVDDVRRLRQLSALCFLFMIDFFFLIRFWIVMFLLMNILSFGSCRGSCR